MTKKFNFSEYCDNWFLSNSSRLKPSSCAKYYVNIEKHIKPYFGAEQLCGITSEKVDEFTRTLIYEKKLSVKTTRDILVYFSSLLYFSLFLLSVPDYNSVQTVPVDAHGLYLYLSPEI